MITLFFNAAQEAAPLPPTGRFVLPEDALAATAVVFAGRRGRPALVPFVVEGGGAPARVVATKGNVTIRGDLVSLDSRSVTVSNAPGMTQTIDGYEALAIEQRDRPVVAIAGTTRASVPPDAQVAFVRRDLSWTPSYLIYLGDPTIVQSDADDLAAAQQQDGYYAASYEDGPFIEQIVGVAEIRNRGDRPVDATDAWLAATRVPLPPPEFQMGFARAHTGSDDDDAEPRALMSERASSQVSAARLPSAQIQDEPHLGVDTADESIQGATRYHLGPLRLDPHASISMPLFAVGAPAHQARVYFCTLPTGPSTPGDRPPPLFRGYRFIVGRAIPPGRVTVFDPDMGFVAVADMAGAVPGEPNDLVLGPSTDIVVDAWTEVTTTYNPVAGAEQNRDQLSANDPRRQPFVVPSGNQGDSEWQAVDGRDESLPAARIAAQVVDHVVVRGLVRNGSRQPATIVLTYRPAAGGTISTVEPACQRMTRGAVEWEMTAMPGESNLYIALDVDRGQRLLANRS
jgi:hypothetical protein